MDYRSYDVVGGFDTIARSYDLANDAMTLGMHRVWRKALCKAASEATPRNGALLDVATGTGDVLLGLLGLRNDLALHGLDPSAQMLRVADEKLSTAHLQANGETPRLMQGDATALPFPDASFDTVTISWGIRNVKPFQNGLREMLRVLRPGGTLLVLESGRPEAPLMRRFYQTYAKLLPFIGQGIAGFKPAYKYYTHTVETFPAGAAFVGELFDAGFVRSGYRPLLGGVCYLYNAQRPQRG